MKKELKDYLHLYLPFEFLFLGFEYKVTGFKDCGHFYQIWHEHGFFDVHKTEFKLPLRKLSDMTDEELKNLRSERGNLKGVERADMNYIIRLNTWSPEDVRYLLSRHFDLFGLISSGLAIDSKTLKEKI